jgi:hypothetical protein
VIYNIPRAAIPAPARAPKYGTELGATPAWLDELLALAGLDEAGEAAAEADLGAAAGELDPLEAAAFRVLLPAALMTEVITALALAPFEEAAEATEAADESEELMPGILLMDSAAARPAKRKVMEKRILALGLLVLVSWLAMSG